VLPLVQFFHVEDLSREVVVSMIMLFYTLLLTFYQYQPSEQSPFTFTY
jgi:hypothetical protein